MELRGDYTHAAADFSVEQNYAQYSEDQHALWSTLLARQAALLPQHAVIEFSNGIAALNLTNKIPSFATASTVLRARTGWEIVPVPGLIPEQAFFDHLAAKRFPITVWLRRSDEIDYLEEPDLFHDFFGHVPLLTDPVFADFMQLYGRAGRRAIEHGGLKMLARLYWYCVEFGLMETPLGLRTYGAGILSSFSETQYALHSAAPLRIRFNLLRVLRSHYLIDDLQKNYFVIRSFRELMDAAVNTDFVPFYREFGSEPGIAPGTRLANDVIVAAQESGSSASNAS